MPGARPKPPPPSNSFAMTERLKRGIENKTMKFEPVPVDGTGPFHVQSSKTLPASKFSSPPIYDTQPPTRIGFAVSPKAELHFNRAIKTSIEKRAIAGELKSPPRPASPPIRVSHQMTERLKTHSPKSTNSSPRSGNPLLLASMSSPLPNRPKSPGLGSDDDELEPEMEARIQARVEARLRALQDLSQEHVLSPSPPLPGSPGSTMPLPVSPARRAFAEVESKETEEADAGDKDQSTPDPLPTEVETELDSADVDAMDLPAEEQLLPASVAAVVLDDQMTPAAATPLWPVEKSLPMSPKRPQASSTPRSVSRRQLSPSRIRNVPLVTTLLPCTVHVLDEKKTHVHGFYGFVQYEKEQGGRLGSLAWTFANKFPQPANLPVSPNKENALRLAPELEGAPSHATPSTYFAIHELQEISIGKQEDVFKKTAFAEVSDLCCLSLVGTSKVHMTFASKDIRDTFLSALPNIFSASPNGLEKKE